jgi:hypothetical protein
VLPRAFASVKAARRASLSQWRRSY